MKERIPKREEDKTEKEGSISKLSVEALPTKNKSMFSMSNHVKILKYWYLG